MGEWDNAPRIEITNGVDRPDSGVSWGGGSGQGNSGNGSSSSGTSSKSTYKAQNMYLDSGGTCFTVDFLGFLYAADINGNQVTRVRALSGTQNMDNEQNRVKAVREQVQDVLSFTSDLSKSIAERYGQEYSKIAESLKANIKGKKVKNYAQAMALFERARVNPNLRINPADVQAMRKAWGAFNTQEFGNNLSRLARAFGVVSMTVNMSKVINETLRGYYTGDWGPLMLQVETITASMAASYAAGFVAALGFTLIGMFVAVPVAVSTVGVALAIALAGAYVDTTVVEQINNAVINR